MPTPTLNPCKPRLQPRSRHYRIDPVGAGAPLMGGLGLITAVLLLKPYAPPSTHAYPRVYAHS